MVSHRILALRHPPPVFIYTQIRKDVRCVCVCVCVEGWRGGVCAGEGSGGHGRELCTTLTRFPVRAPRNLGAPWCTDRTTVHGRDNGWARTNSLACGPETGVRCAVSAAYDEAAYELALFAHKLLGVWTGQGVAAHTIPVHCVVYGQNPMFAPSSRSITQGFCAHRHTGQRNLCTRPHFPVYARGKMRTDGLTIGCPRTWAPGVQGLEAPLPHATWQQEGVDSALPAFVMPRSERRRGGQWRP